MGLILFEKIWNFYLVKFPFCCIIFSLIFYQNNIQMQGGMDSFCDWIRVGMKIVYPKNFKLFLFSQSVFFLGQKILNVFVP
jgi:hypothetical protein